ncbi:hypothetical protein IM40_07680 [Candidatus Paracaedimonas acanthamoebae]|nr:hypothetical protein IM40_07680 [Candidatus Paracaedimonas acanthamoebae]
MRIIRVLLTILSLTPAYASSTTLEWEPLKEGRKVHIIAPSSGPEETKAYLNTSITFLKENGFSAEAPNDLIIPQPLGYANTLAYRQKHLKEVLFAENVDVVWALRGGRGASKVIMPLEDLAAPSRIKLILGYSDTTVVHLLAAKWGWPSLHCSVLAYHQDGAQVVNKKTSLQPIFDILLGKTQEVSYNLEPLNSIAQECQGTIYSQIRGGNASVIQRSIGTLTHLKTSGRILFLEDTGEPATKFLEMMTQFQRARLFKEVEAIILGDFENGLNDSQRLDLRLAKKTFAEEMSEFKIPVLGSDCFGHADFNDPLPFGTPTQLDFQGPNEVNLRVSTTGAPLKENK